MRSEEKTEHQVSIEGNYKVNAQAVHVEASARLHEKAMSGALFDESSSFASMPCMLAGKFHRPRPIKPMQIPLELLIKPLSEFHPLVCSSRSSSEAR
jgi:hypothetical protein